MSERLLTSTGPSTLGRPHHQAATVSPQRYRTQVFEGATAVLAAVRAAPASPSPFMSPGWLQAIYRDLAPAFAAEPVAVAVRNGETSALAMLVPLVLRRDGRLTIAEFPDFGVADYKKPILGPAAPRDPQGAKAALTALTSALTGTDLLHLTNMQEQVGDSPNPLVIAGNNRISRHRGSRIVIDGSYEDYLRSRGKKYRTDVERCFRHLHKAGDVRFQRAETPEEIRKTFALLEDFQKRRRNEIGGSYVLDQPHYSTFYRNLLLDEAECGLAQIYALSVDGEVIATLYALVLAGTVTVLRFSTGDKRWSYLAPGRLILMSTIQHFIARDVRCFDFGIGEYPFKDGFGFKSYSLHDRTQTLSWRALPRAALEDAKLRIRAHPRLKALADRLRARG